MSHLSVPRRVFALLPCLALAACGDDAPGSIDAYLEAQIAKECAQYFRCEAGYEDSRAAYRATRTEADCRANEVETLEGTVRAYVADGTVRYDAAAGAACLGSYDDLCVGGAVPECARVLVGTVPGDAACAADVQCISGRCSATGAPACGVCERILADGETCGSGLPPCGPFSICDEVCTPGEPWDFAQAGRGERCGEDVAGHDFVACAPDLPRSSSATDVWRRRRARCMTSHVMVAPRGHAMLSESNRETGHGIDADERDAG